MINLGWAVIISLLSGLIGAILAALFSAWHIRSWERTKAKIDTLKRLMGFRYDLKSEGFSRALNEIYVVFNDSKPVLDLLDKLWQYGSMRADRQITDDTFVSLVKAMAASCGLSTSQMNDTILLRAFNIRSEN